MTASPSSPRGKPSWSSLLNEITIGETCFFRNQPQLDALRNIVIPKILDAKSDFRSGGCGSGALGCSTGEEPYTLSMFCWKSPHGRLKDWTIEILATDLNERSLAHAKNAIYGTYSTRNLTPYYRQKYFAPAGEQLQVQPVGSQAASPSAVSISPTMVA